MYNFNTYKIFYHYSIMAKENTLRIFPIHFKRANIFAPIKIQSYALSVLINIYIFFFKCETEYRKTKPNSVYIFNQNN